ncbi:MAG: alpha/beta fold hydrolase [Clostridiaceae bacterium]
MYFEEYGDRNNQTIIFLHCAAIVEIYLKQYSLSERYHIIVPHLYGSGREVKTDFSFEKNEKAIVSIIKDIIKEKAYIIGHSEGANMTFALVSHYPELFHKAIISSPMIDKSDKIAKMKSGFVSFMYGIVKTKWIGKTYVKFLNINDKERESFFLDYWTKISKNTWKNYYTDRVTFEMCPQFNEITIPVLCILGRKEPKVIKETVEKMQKINSSCNIKYIEGVGHEHPVKKADELKEIIKNYFS